MFDDAVKMMQALPPQAKASMLEDLERGRRLELPWLSGAVVRIGRETRRGDADSPLHQRGAEAARQRGAHLVAHFCIDASILPTTSFSAGPPRIQRTTATMSLSQSM